MDRVKLPDGPIASPGEDLGQKMASWACSRRARLRSDLSRRVRMPQRRIEANLNGSSGFLRPCANRKRHPEAAAHAGRRLHPGKLCGRIVDDGVDICELAIVRLGNLDLETAMEAAIARRISNVQDNGTRRATVTKQC